MTMLINPRWLNFTTQERLVARRTAGLFLLYQAALEKEETADQEESLDVNSPAWASELPAAALTASPRRSPAMTRNIESPARHSQNVRREARAESRRIQKLPQIKWTGGSDLLDEVVDMLRPGTRERELVHSGYVDPA